MFVPIGNTPRDYAWGSTTAIAELLGTRPSGGPQAELWLGAHAGSPSRILEPTMTGGATTLEQWIQADPDSALGGPPARLPFLLKVLAAAAPLSLQAHPSPAQARAGFERENAAGVALDDPARNYKDPFHKPELIVALSESFEALCGFRTPEQITGVFGALVRVAARAGADADAATLRAFASRFASRSDADTEAGVPGTRGAPDILRDAVAWLLGGDDAVAPVVDAVVTAARSAAGRSAAREHDDFAREWRTVTMLAGAYPGDPGIVLSLLLNRVSLERGEALYLPAGNIHAYLNGLGIELMAASDNVLRGGLTGKHIDVPELLAVLDFTPLPVPYLRPQVSDAGVQVFGPDVPDFALRRLRVDAGAAPVPLVTGPSIVLCTEGAIELTGRHGAARPVRGEAMFVTPDEGKIAAAGAGEAFIASRNISV